MMTRIKNHFKLEKGQGLSKDDLLDTAEISSISRPCVLYGELFTKYDLRINEVFSKTNTNGTRKSISGDILLPATTTTKPEDLAKASVIRDSNVLLGSDLHILRKRNNNYNPVYVAYYLSYTQKNYFSNLNSGVTISHSSKKDVGAIEIPLPSMDQQTQIVTFLDTETSKIDRKISILEQKYEKLEEYKQSVIFETVTKGLDSNVEMKDSGIDWIGEIPKHWEVKRVKDLFLLKKGKNAGTYSAEYIHDEENKGEYPVYSGQTENEGVMGSIKTFEYTYLNGVLFTTTVGAKAMSVKRLFNKFSLSQNCGLLVPTKEINLSYSYYLISSCFSFARQSIPSHMQPSLRKEDLNIFYCLDIPFNEQESIGVYLDTFSSKIDKKKEIIKKQIELLKEYKQTIIYEAVTGKMEIL